jgi:hypothetical protein
MLGLVVAIASLLATHPATKAPLSFGAPPLSEAELASATAAGNDNAPVMAPGTAPGPSFDVTDRAASSLIAKLVSDTGAQSTNQQDTALNFRVTLRIR